MPRSHWPAQGPSILPPDALCHLRHTPFKKIEPKRARDAARRWRRVLSDVCCWPLATDRIFMADGRFGCEADMAGPAAGSTRSLVTLNGHVTLVRAL